MRKLLELETMPGYVGLVHRKEGDEIVPRISEQTNRYRARTELQRSCEAGEELQLVFPLALACELGIEAAAAFRPRSQFELEDMALILDKNEMVDLGELGDKIRRKLDREREEHDNQGEIGPFKLTAPIGPIGDQVCWNEDLEKDAEMVAMLIERVVGDDLIEIPTANGSPIVFKVGIDKGFGNWQGDDTCVIRMYCEEWEHLASEVMPVGMDFFALVIDRAQTEQGRPLAQEIVLATLEYANTVYRHLAPYLNDEEREAAGIDQVAS